MSVISTEQESSVAVDADEEVGRPRVWQSPRYRRWAIQLAVIIVILAAWQGVSGRLVDKLYVSAPWDVIHRMFTLL